ncbi:putative cobalt transporter CbtA [Nocardioides cavernae]|uniref:Putative cobalt transporter CbtA n=1 Tax=Nocardioides cavernae TaxID=1921566 RepID=A0A7Y9KTB1_9ACTN|nr:CbtA family protein [Nocardioides cavernae]NYE36658.1 putative cobalt transporter CbtA [Nocardioides cavernae]
MGARTFLVHGLVAGLLAGIAAFVVAYTVGEPQIDKAIALEEAASAPASDGHDHTHADSDESAGHSHGDEAAVSRTAQSTVGLATGTLAVGVVLGGFTGLLAALGLGRLGSLRPAASTALLAAIGAVSFSIVPFLKYPATPPAVGSGETIDSRTAVYFGFVAVSVAGAVAAIALARWGARRWSGVPGVLAGLGAYALVVVVAAVAFPKIDELGDFPAGILWDFRVSSLLTLLAMWAVIGAVLVALVDRTWRRHSDVRARRELAASL